MFFFPREHCSARKSSFSSMGGGGKVLGKSSIAQVSQCLLLSHQIHPLRIIRVIHSTLLSMLFATKNKPSETIKAFIQNATMVAHVSAFHFSICCALSPLVLYCTFFKSPRRTRAAFPSSIFHPISQPYCLAPASYLRIGKTAFQFTSSLQYSLPLSHTDCCLYFVIIPPPQPASRQESFG